MQEKKLILININVGNNPSRIRFLIYLKGLENQIDFKTPMDYGGWGSDEFKKVNPQGKVPALILEDGTILFEARVISGYIADRFRRRVSLINYKGGWGRILWTKLIKFEQKWMKKIIIKINQNHQNAKLKNGRKRENKWGRSGV